MSCFEGKTLADPKLEAKAQTFETNLENTFNNNSKWNVGMIATKQLTESFIADTLKLQQPQQHDVFQRAQEFKRFGSVQRGSIGPTDVEHRFRRFKSRR